MGFFCQNSILLPRSSFLVPREVREYFGAEDLVGSIALCVLHGTAGAAGEEEDLLVAQRLDEVVVEVASLLGIVQDEK